MKKRIRLLLVEDSESDAELILHRLKKEGLEIEHERVQTGEAMRKSLAEAKWDVVLSDYSMPQFDAMAAWEILQASGTDIPFIIVSGKIGEETAIEAMRMGVQDYIMKDKLDRLVPAVVREVTDAGIRRAHRRDEEEKRRLEARYRMLFENAGEGIAVVKDGVFLLVNPLLMEVLGKKEEEVIGRPFEDFVYEEDRKKVVGFYRRRIRGQKAPEMYEFRINDGAGLTRWIENRAVLIDWGEEKATLNFLTDISDRKAYQEQLDREQHTLQTILDNIPVMIFFYDSAGQTIFANRESQRLLGRTLEEMQSIDIMEACFPDEGLRKRVLDFMIQCPPEWRDHPITTKSGESFDSSWYNIKLPDGSHIGIGIDISQRKQYERDLVAAKEQLESERHVLKSILEHIPVMIALYDQTGKIILANRSTEQILGWTFEEIQQMDIMKAGYPDEELRREVWKYMMESSGEWRDFPVATKSGKSIESSWFNLKLPDGMRLGIGIDNSQRKAYERELIAAKEQLEIERSALQDKNIALREVLSQIEAEKDTIKNRVLVNIQRSILTNLSRLKDQAPPSLAKNIELIEKSLQDIASPFIGEFTEQFRELTARELEICRLIKDGLRTKEMANMLNVSLATIQKHRESIRRKLKLTGKGTNLYAYLQSFAEKIDSGQKLRARRPRRRKR